MYQTQIKLLNDVAADLLTSVAKLKPLEALAAAAEGRKCLAEARAIADTLRGNTPVLFIECCAHLGKAGTSYPAYLEFCARNSLAMLSQEDFEGVVREIFPSGLE